jgi:putative nucleotidyltransferase with HDIG domain
MKPVRANYTWDANYLWQHAVATAVISSALAKRVQVIEATAFTAGLLHDIGKRVLVSMEGVVYADMVRTAGFFGPALVAAETSSLGFSHAAVGARLLARWGLPESLCLAVEMHHHSPVAARDHMRLAAVVNFANSLAHQMIDAPTGAPEAAEANPEAMELVELTTKEIPPLVQQLNVELERVQALLRMHA